MYSFGIYQVFGPTMDGGMVKRLLQEVAGEVEGGAVDGGGERASEEEYRVGHLLGL